MKTSIIVTILILISAMCPFFVGLEHSIGLGFLSLGCVAYAAIMSHLFFKEKD